MEQVPNVGLLACIRFFVTASFTIIIINPNNSILLNYYSIIRAKNPTKKTMDAGGFVEFRFLVPAKTGGKIFH